MSTIDQTKCPTCGRSLPDTDTGIIIEGNTVIFPNGSSVQTTDRIRLFLQALLITYPNYADRGKILDTMHKLERQRDRPLDRYVDVLSYRTNLAIKGTRYVVRRASKVGYKIEKELI